MQGSGSRQTDLAGGALFALLSVTSHGCRIAAALASHMLRRSENAQHGAHRRHREDREGSLLCDPVGQRASC
jgi:hypothetical protein